MVKVRLVWVVVRAAESKIWTRRWATRDMGFLLAALGVSPGSAGAEPTAQARRPSLPPVLHPLTLKLVERLEVVGPEEDPVALRVLELEDGQLGPLGLGRLLVAGLAAGPAQPLQVP